jgi:hypothetical protein
MIDDYYKGFTDGLELAEKYFEAKQWLLDRPNENLKEVFNKWLKK